jgi:RNA polymerase sigma-70 factor (ECF subfamily)
MRALWRGPRGEPSGVPDDGAGDADLAALARHDPHAYEALFRRYWDPVFRYCYHRLGSWEDAEDAAGQVFADAFAGRGQFAERGGGSAGSFRSWLFWIAHNEVVSGYRRRERRPAVPLAAAYGLADPAPSPEALAVDADAHDRALALLARLPEDQRRVCELRLAGLSGKEIAEVLGKHHDAVRTAQSRAEARLRDLIGVAAAGKGAPRG